MICGVLGLAVQARKERQLISRSWLLTIGACVLFIGQGECARAEGPEGRRIRPGVTVMPFRHFDPSTNKIINRPRSGYEGTCWRVTHVKGGQVGVELIGGVFRPHWEEGQSFTTFRDEYSVSGDGVFPFDLQKGEFAMFRVGACP